MTILIQDENSNSSYQVKKWRQRNPWLNALNGVTARTNFIFFITVSGIGDGTPFFWSVYVVFTRQKAKTSSVRLNFVNIMLQTYWFLERKLVHTPWKMLKDFWSKVQVFLILKIIWTGDNASRNTCSRQFLKPTCEG